MCKKSFFTFIVFAVLIVLAKQFCYKKTDGFALYKIRSSLCFHEEWETTTPIDKNELSSIFDQPFSYLAKGAQSYVFASQDGQTVIKFFRLYHLRPPAWLMALTLPPALQPFKIGKMLEKRRELCKDFASYKIAFEQMREETGLIYLHLNKTSHLKKKLTLVDKIGIAHNVDLDAMEFLVQKRAALVYPAIEQVMQTQGPQAAKAAISSLVHLLLARSQKGIFDKDPDLNTNFGFLNLDPIQIDIGRFCFEEKRKDPQASRDELIRITDNFRQWLDGKYPELSEHLQQEIREICIL